MPVIEYGKDKMPNDMKKRSPIPPEDSMITICQCKGCGYPSRHTLPDICGGCGSDTIQTRMTQKEYSESFAQFLEKRNDGNDTRIAAVIRRVFIES